MKTKTVYLLLIVLIALAVRLYHLTYPIVDMTSFRQTQTASTIRNFYMSGIDVLHPKIDVAGEPGYLVLEFPLYQAIVAVLYKLFFPSEIWGRIVSIIFGLVGALYLYRLVHLLLGQDLAILSIIFFLFAPLNIFYHRAIMIDPLVVTLSLMYLYYSVVYVQQRGRKAFWLALLSGIAGFVNKAPYLPTLFLPIAYLQLRKSSLLKLLHPSFISLFIVPTLCLLAWQTHAESVNSQYEVSNYFVLSNPSHRLWIFGTMDLRMDWSFYHRLVDTLHFGVLATIGTPLFVVGLFSKSCRKANWFFHIWLAAGLLSYLIFANLNYVHNYYSLNLIPPIAVFCGVGLLTLYHWLQTLLRSSPAVGLYRHHLATFLIVVLVVDFIWFASTRTLSSRYYEVAYEHIVNGQLIKAVSKPDELVLIARPGGDWHPGVLYYAERRGYAADLDTLDKEKLGYFAQKGVRLVAIITDQTSEDIDVSRLFSDSSLLARHGNLSIYKLAKSAKL